MKTLKTYPVRWRRSRLKIENASERLQSVESETFPARAKAVVAELSDPDFIAVWWHWQLMLMPQELVINRTTRSEAIAVGQTTNTSVGCREQANLLRYQTSKELVALAPHRVKPAQSLIKFEGSTARFVMLVFLATDSYLWSSLGFIPADLVQLCQFISILIARTTFIMLTSDLMCCSLSDIKLLMPCQPCVSPVCTTVSEAPQVHVPDITVPQRPLSVNTRTFAILVLWLCQAKLLIAQNHFVVCSTAAQTIFDTVTERRKETTLLRMITWN